MEKLVNLPPVRLSRGVETEKPKPRCGLCQHFLKAPADPKNLSAPPVGICRRFPPLPVIIPQKNKFTGQMETQPAGMRPPVQAGDYCAEYSPFIAGINE